MALLRSELPRPCTAHGDPAAEKLLSETLRPAVWWAPARMRSRLKARTTFLDEVILEALGGGATQVVILGAGYDCRALQLRKPGTRFFEIDHPVTQEDKKQRLTDLDLFPGEVAYLGVDFNTESVSTALEDAGHLPRQPTVFICEGLLLYLSPKTVRQLFQSLHDRAGNGSLIVLTVRVYPKKSAGAWLARLIGLLRRIVGEAERSHYTHGELRSLLRATGFSPVRESLYHPSPRSKVGTLMIAAAPSRAFQDATGSRPKRP